MVRFTHPTFLFVVAILAPAVGECKAADYCAASRCDTLMRQLLDLRLIRRLAETVGKIVEPSTIRWIGFSHFEADECGALNEWLEVAPSAEAVCTFVGAVVNVNDFASRPAHPMKSDDALSTGKYRFRLCHTPHLPHGWDAGMLFEETQRTMFCSDLFHQLGDVEALTESDVVARFRDALTQYQAGPLRSYMPYTPNTERLLAELAALQPRVLAAMHGSAFAGDGEKALWELGPVLKEILGS